MASLDAQLLRGQWISPDAVDITVTGYSQETIRDALKILYPLMSYGFHPSWNTNPNEETGSEVGIIWDLQLQRHSNVRYYMWDMD